MNKLFTHPHAPVGRISLHHEVAALMRAMILEHELKPGDKIDENALCTRFGVSRTPVREALKVLANEGLIQLMSNRGARVAQTSAEEVEELFPIIGALEALAGELACERITDWDIERLQSLHDNMLLCFQRGDHAGYVRLNRDIHLQIFAISGNPELNWLYQGLQIRTHAIRYVARKTPERWQMAVDEHEQIMNALKQRDGKQLAHILKHHLKNKAEMVSEYLAGTVTP